MAELRVSKSIILPRVDNIKDPEAKRVIQELFKVIRNMNDDNYNDHTYNFEGRIHALENP